MFDSFKTKEKEKKIMFLVYFQRNRLNNNNNYNWGSSIYLQNVMYKFVAIGKIVAGYYVLYFLLKQFNSLREENVNTFIMSIVWHKQCINTL